MINEQLNIIRRISAIIDLKTIGTPDSKPPNLELFSLLHELEKLGTEPIIAKKEYFRKKYLKEASKNIPNLNDL